MNFPEDVVTAADRVRPYIRKTHLTHSRPFSDLVNADDITFKWLSAYDVDTDPDFSQSDNDIELLYRLELVDYLSDDFF